MGAQAEMRDAFTERERARDQFGRLARIVDRAQTCFDREIHRRAPEPPADGVGLTPLLQHPSMMIHPPMLYSGYTLFTIPFAFAIGALVTRDTEPGRVYVGSPAHAVPGRSSLDVRL